MTPVPRSHLTSGWYFDDTCTCIENDPIHKLLKLLTPFSVWFDEVGEQCNIYILKALLQYAVESGTSPFEYKDGQENSELPVNIQDIGTAIVNKFKYTTDGKSMTKPFDLRDHLQEYVKEQKEKKISDRDKYVLSHKADNTNSWEYLIVVMIKQKLMHGYGIDEKPAGTLEEDIGNAYTHSMGALITLCQYESVRKHEDIGKPADIRITKYKRLEDQLKKGDIPDGLNAGRMVDRKQTILAEVQDWYTWFLVQRVFSRRVASVVTQYIEKGISRNIDTALGIVETQLMDASIDVENGEFNVKKFANSCLKFDKNNQLSNFLDEFDKLKGFNSVGTKINKMGASHWNELVYTEQNNTVRRIDVSLLRIFLRSLFDCFGVRFENNPTRSLAKYHIPDPARPRFRPQNLRQFIAIIHSRTAMKMQATGSHVMPFAAPTVGSIGSSVTTGTRVGGVTDRGRGILINKSESGRSAQLSDMTHEWGDFQSTIDDFKSAYAEYKTRNELTENGTTQTETYKSSCETRLAALIEKNLGIAISRTNVNIPDYLVALLKNLDTPERYKNALGSVVSILSKNYAHTSNIPALRPLSNHPKTDTDWRGWSDHFKFFISLLLAGLIYDRKCTFRELVHIEFSMKKRIQPDATEFLNYDECREYVYRFRCYEWFQSIFQVGSTVAVPSKYTIDELLGLISDGMKRPSAYQNKIFEWDRDGYNTKIQKNIVEHTLCLILILFGVDTLPGDILYNDVGPPQPMDEVEKSPSKPPGDVEKSPSKPPGDVEKSPSKPPGDVEKSPSKPPGDVEKSPSKPPGDVDKSPSKRPGDVDKMGGYRFNTRS
jgi:hypothetical protein